MAFVLSDRIKETTTTTSTGTYTLGGAVSGFETFTANLSNGDTTYYCCTDGTDFEVGLGTFASSGTTLARTTIISSSNSNNAVNWSSGSRDIFCTLPGSKAVFKDGSDNINGTFVGNITGNVTGNASGTAATVTGAAQSNITSVGTLTGLTTSGTINLSQTSGTAITTSGSLSNADLGILRAHAGGDTHGFTIKYMGSRSGNNNSYSLFMDNQSGTDVEAMTVFQDGKVGINNTSPSARLDVVGDVELVGDVTGLTSLTVDDITINGSTISDSGQLTIDAGADILLDAAGNEIRLRADGTEFASLRNDSSDFLIRSAVADKDIKIQGVDGSSTINALTFDMSDAGAATFNDKITAVGTSVFTNLDISGDVDIDGTLETDALSIASTTVTATATELNYVDVTTLGTVQASKAVTADANGNVLFPNDEILKFGNNGNLEIFYNGAHSIIKDGGSGDLELDGSTVRIRNASRTKDMLVANQGGSLELYHNNNKKFETTSDGATITGDATITSTADGGPILNLVSNDHSDASDFAQEGAIKFFADNDADQSTLGFMLYHVLGDVTDGVEDGWLYLNNTINGSNVGIAAFGGGNFYLLDDDAQIEWNLTRGTSFDVRLQTATPTADRTVTLPDATGTVLTTGNSDTPTTTTSSSDADFVLVDDGGTMKKITPSNLGITSGGASKGFAVAMAIAL